VGEANASASPATPARLVGLQNRRPGSSEEAVLDFGVGENTAEPAATCSAVEKSSKGRGDGRKGLHAG